jgi:hypothetical protein
MTGTRPPTVGASDRRPARDDERHAPSRQGAPRQAIARVRPGPIERRRALPIRRAPEDVRARWDERELRAAILEGIPVRDASLEIGEEDRDWGHTVTIGLELSSPMPGTAAQALAGKAVRRLKALCETGEIPNTDFNPSARDDAGERAS